ncbi:MAG TPA: shikimate kinase [Deltaproteobacteria bacterium]|nr:shikimate kinase [Deltaproteobacteria bacterium]
MMRNSVNIVLIGYRCCGKTTVGSLLSRDLGMEFLDTDRLIEEETGLPVHSYVAQKGWGAFRAVERGIVRSVASMDKAVIATGGGVVTDMESVRDLKKNGWIAWLMADAAVIRERMRDQEAGGSMRPPLSGVDAADEVDQILWERRPLYARASDCTFSTDGHGPRQVATEIVAAFSRQLADRPEEKQRAR